MFSIKSSKASCNECKLLDAPSCILETNSSEDLTKIEIMFIAENPGKDEVEAERPLVGKAGKIFRTPFDKYIKDNFKYVLTNTVLCQTLVDGKTGNPDDETIHNCKANCFHIINVCKPKLIVLMGTSPCKAFDLASEGITKLREKNPFEWNGYQVLLTLHPSYVARNRNTMVEQNFNQDIKKAAEMLGKEFAEERQFETKPIQKEPRKDIGAKYYKIPDKYYTEDYYLVDIQHLNRTNEVLYIFRDKDNKKEFYKTPDVYYYYECLDRSKANKTMRYSDLIAKEVDYRSKKELNNEVCYEGDLKITAKSAIDYYLMKKVEERNYDLKVLFFDIEIDMKGIQEFPNPEETKYEVCLLSYYYNGKLTTYIINDPKQNINNLNGEVRIFNNEKELLNQFMDDLKTLDIDIITGWNVINFDLAYIFNRVKLIGLDPNKMSRFAEVYVDSKYEHAHIPGIICLDMLNLYKTFTFGKKESYKLGSISQEELGTTKTYMEENFATIYSANINKYIEYNRKDVMLLVELDNKLEHIRFQNELRRLCSGSFDSANSSMGQVDGLIVSYLKNKGIASKNGLHIKSAIEIPGAYVKEPNPSIYQYFCDFDFSSLYPSLILTYNIGPNSAVFKFKDPTHGYDFIYDFGNLPKNVEVIENFVNHPVTRTVDKDKLLEFVNKHNLVYTINGCFYRNHDDELSFFAEILGVLLSGRKQYKAKMFEAKMAKDAVATKLYDTKQMVLKIVANTAYGVLANYWFRFFNPDLATSITRSGQEALKTSLVAAHCFIEELKGKKVDSIPKLTKKDMYTSENLSIDTPNVITGDTDSIFACYQDLIKAKEEDKILEQIREYNKQVQTYLNKDVLSELIRKHNVDIKHSKLELKNEIVAKRGIFLAKKRYSAYIVEQEGRPIEEMLTKGLETRRSDFSNYTKESLNELLELLLKSKEFSLKTIMKFVNEKKQSFLKKIVNREKDIAKPVSFSKALSEYKVIPQGVNSMLNFNDLEYHAFSVGDRGSMYKINGIDESKAPIEIINRYYENFLTKGKKLEVISIPDEMEKLPDYYIVDKNELLTFAWIDRYKLLLDPLLKVDLNDGILQM